MGFCSRTLAVMHGGHTAVSHPYSRTHKRRWGQNAKGAGEGLRKREADSLPRSGGCSLSGRSSAGKAEGGGLTLGSVFSPNCRTCQHTTGNSLEPQACYCQAGC